MKRNEAPHGLHRAEGPRPAYVPVTAREGAPQGKRQDEATVPSLECVHEHHEREDDNSVNRDPRHVPTIEVGAAPLGQGRDDRSEVHRLADDHMVDPELLLQLE